MSDQTPENTDDLTPEEADTNPSDSLTVEESAGAVSSQADTNPSDSLTVEEPAGAVSSQEAAIAEGAEEAAPAAEPVAEETDAEEEPAPREKPAIPGMDLDVDLVLEGEDERDRWSEDDDQATAAPADGEDGEDEDILQEPITATIQLSADARYRATGKRKTAIARVTLKPGTGVYTVNGRTLDEFFPRDTLRRTIRQPLETVGYEDKVDVIARMHGGGVSAQAGALRHGISRALLEADPNLRTDLKRRGFLTRDARAKERKKAGLKKARKRPQFSKR
jgi:small subunit ribosomal protein S9